jgi:hypothetical protein
MITISQWRKPMVDFILIYYQKAIVFLKRYLKKCMLVIHFIISTKLECLMTLSRFKFVSKHMFDEP